MILYGYVNMSHRAIIFLSERGDVRQNKNLAQSNLVPPNNKGDHRGLDRKDKKLEDIGDLFDRLCGKLLAPMLRLMRDFLTTEYARTPDLPDRFASGSPGTIDRILSPGERPGAAAGPEPDKARYPPAGPDTDAGHV